MNTSHVHNHTASEECLYGCPAFKSIAHDQCYLAIAHNHPVADMTCPDTCPAYVSPLKDFIQHQASLKGAVAQQTLKGFEGGSTRSECLMYDLIPPEAIEALARRLTLGAQRHGKNNWKQGKEEFRTATIAHTFKHLMQFMQNGNVDDENLDALICNVAFLIWQEKHLGPYHLQLEKGKPSAE